MVRFLFLCWITGGHTVHPSIEGLLSPNGVEPTLFQHFTSKVAGLRVHATTPCIDIFEEEYLEPS